MGTNEERVDLAPVHLHLNTNQESIDYEHQNSYIDVDSDSLINCANCNLPISNTKNGRVTTFPIVVNSCNKELPAVTIKTVLYNIFQFPKKVNYDNINLNVLNTRDEDERNNIALCSRCAEILQNLFQFYQEFTNLTNNENSFFRKIISQHDSQVQFCDKTVQTEILQTVEAFPENCNILPVQTSVVSVAEAEKCKRNEFKQTACDIKIETNQEYLESDLPGPSRLIVCREPIVLQKPEKKPVLNSQLNCPDCGKRLKFLSLLKVHAERVHGHRVHLYPRCGKLVCKRTQVENDMRKHEEKCHLCDQCGKAFRAKCELQRHKFIHKPREFTNAVKGELKICPICGKLFTYPSQLRLHMIQNHEKKKKYECYSCGLCFFKKVTLDMHLKRHAGNKLQFFNFNLCPLSFINEAILKSQKKVQVPKIVKKPLCEMCGKSFYGSEKLKRHIMAAHTTTKSYTCEICGKSFALICALVSHIKCHKGNKDFLCAICGQGFVTKSALQRHTRIHRRQTLCL